MPQKRKPLKYFLSEISPYRPIKASCPCCKTETTYSSHIHLSTSEGSIYINYYQCQSCGKLETSDEKNAEGIRVALETACECGGQFRRDKNIFCPVCQYRQSDENKAEDKLIATPEEMENLAMRHDSEELKPGYKGEDVVSNIEEVEEESDMKKLFNALRELTKDDTPYKFGFTGGGKGLDGYFDDGLNDDMEYQMYSWMHDVLAPESNYNATDYELTFDGNTINVDCFASWGGWMYENLNSYEDLFCLDVVNLLLPNLDFENVNLEELSLPFECTIDEGGYDFSWGADSIRYYDEDTEVSYEISLEELKPKLEPLLYENIRGFDSAGGVDQEGSWSKKITVEPNEVNVEESISFCLSFDIDEF